MPSLFPPGSLGTRLGGENTKHVDVNVASSCQIQGLKTQLKEKEKNIERIEVCTCAQRTHHSEHNLAIAECVVVCSLNTSLYQRGVVSYRGNTVRTDWRGRERRSWSYQHGMNW